MKVYEIVAWSRENETLFSKLVLSEHSLTTETKNLNTIAQINTDLERIVSVRIPQLIMDAWTEEEWNEMSDIKNKYF